MPTIYGGGGYGGVWDQIEHPPTMYIYSSLEKNYTSSFYSVLGIKSDFELSKCILTSIWTAFEIHK